MEIQHRNPIGVLSGGIAITLAPQSMHHLQVEYRTRILNQFLVECFR